MSCPGGILFRQGSVEKMHHVSLCLSSLSAQYLVKQLTCVLLRPLGPTGSMLGKTRSHDLIAKPVTAGLNYKSITTPETWWVRGGRGFQRENREITEKGERERERVQW